MRTAKITIVTPTFNRAHTLTRVYSSLQKQTFKDFVWLIADDGSTDDTEALIQSFIIEEKIDVIYQKYENSKKFYTVFKAIETVDTPFFTILDSDDAYVENALEVMHETVKVLDSEHFISATFNSCYPDGSLVGTLFPKDFDGTILEMRTQLGVRGDKHTIFIRKVYQEYLAHFDYEKYKNLYAPQRIFFQIYDSQNRRSRFVNKTVRIYFEDKNDSASMSNDRVKPSSYLGLRDGHLSFINNYGNQLWTYPVTFIRNLIGYLTYSVLMKNNYLEIVKKINKPFTKLLATLLLPLVIIYSKFFIRR